MISRGLRSLDMYVTARQLSTWFDTQNSGGNTTLELVQESQQVSSTLPSCQKPCMLVLYNMIKNLTPHF